MQGKKRTGTAKRTDMDMLHGPLGKKILAVAMPLALTSMLQQVFNAVDVAVIGQTAGKSAMAAAGSNGPLISVLVNLMAGLSLGANVVISGFIGSGDSRKIHQAVHTSILTALAGGMVILVFGECAAAPLLRLLSVPDEIMPMALTYLRIYLTGVPLMVLYNFEASILRCIGDTRTPFLCLSASGLLNVGLNLFFVFRLGMTVDGVALATVLSNVVSAAVLFAVLCRSQTQVRIRRAEFRISRGLLVRVLKIGVPAGLQLMMFSLANMCIQSAVNSLGTDAMAGAAASNNLECLGYFLISSFGQACTTFVGQNYGADNMERCKKAVRLCVVQDYAVSILASALMLLFNAQLIGIFNQDPAVIAAARTRLFFIVPAWLFSILIEVLSGGLRGYGYSLAPALASMAGTCGVRVFWVLVVFARYPRFDVLMSIYPVSIVITALAILAAYAAVVRRLQKRQKISKTDQQINQIDQVNQIDKIR